MASVFGSNMRILPEELGSIRPGSEWCWEPLKIESRCYIRVTFVEKKAGGNWWVLAQPISPTGVILEAKPVWNELSRFIEAAVLTKAAS